VSLVPEEQVSQLGRHGECDHEIIGRHLFLTLVFQPLLRFMMLAMRTVTVAAGMWKVLVAVTGVTMDLHHGTVAVSTGLHGCQRFTLRGKQAMTILVQKVAFKLLNNGG